MEQMGRRAHGGNAGTAAWVRWAVFAVLLAGAVSLLAVRGAAAQSSSPADELLPAPTITVNPDIYYPFDEVLYLEGRAQQNAAVQIQFERQGSKPVRFGVESDATGEWVLAEKVPLDPGDWEVRARVLGEKDQVSEWSNPRVFKAIQTGITIGGVNVKFAALSFVIIVLLIFGAAVSWYFMMRVRQLKAALVAKEIREARETVQEGLAEIRRDLMEELRLLESRSRKLSPEDLARKEHILRELDSLERNMAREIGDIESRTRTRP